MPIKIKGTGRNLPRQVIDNEYLSSIVDTSDEWIISRTGIKTRYITKEETTTSMAIEAVRVALKNAEISSDDIDYIIVATMSSDHCLPNTACEVQAAIGATKAVCMDISAACSGFIYAMDTAHALMKANEKRYSIVIGAELVSKLLDWSERSTCVLFGDGAGAAVIEYTQEGMTDFLLGSDGRKGKALFCIAKPQNNLLVKKEAYDYMTMDGKEILQFTLRIIPQNINELLESNHIPKDRIKYFLLHQANKRILEAVSKRLGVDIDHFPMNLQKYGNTSAASIPILLDELNKNHQLKQGDYLVLTGFGGGLTWGSMLLQW